MIASLEIRPYEPRDHAQVVALWSDVFPDDPPWNEPASMILISKRRARLIKISPFRIRQALPHGLKDLAGRVGPRGLALGRTCFCLFDSDLVDV